MGYGSENFEKVPKGEKEILAKLDVEEHGKVVNPERGQSLHVFFGHGANQSEFEDREFATTNNEFYEKKPGHPAQASILLQPKLANIKSEDIGKFGKTGGVIKPKDYSSSTKLFDQTWRNIGFRG